MNGANEVVESWKNIVHAMERDWPRLRRSDADSQLREERPFVSAVGQSMRSPAEMTLGPPG